MNPRFTIKIIDSEFDSFQFQNRNRYTPLWAYLSFSLLINFFYTVTVNQFTIFFETEKKKKSVMPLGSVHRNSCNFPIFEWYEPTKLRANSSLSENLATIWKKIVWNKQSEYHWKFLRKSINQVLFKRGKMLNQVLSMLSHQKMSAGGF